MEQFVYHNLFETKGIEYIITIIFFALLVPFWLTLNRRYTLKEQVPKGFGTITAEILRIPQGLFYCPNHLWSHLEESGLVKVGIDDFFQHIAGEIQLNHYMEKGFMVDKGQVLFEIRHNEKSLTLTAPISGTIEEINPEVIKNQWILNSDPYGTGWIYKIRPVNWKQEIASCYLAEEATGWMKDELGRFRGFISEAVTRNMPEVNEANYLHNGEPVDHILTFMPSVMWNDFQKNFLDKV
ncbi:MAG: hypothetical protein JXL81_03850 [Deltaproteobacteria bacterium]|nr:hypothetical protein [Deltaproteobacteria bacterium]